MTVDESYNLIKTNRPKLIYVSGKSSTGKSTFTKKLAQDFHYTVIELDQIVLDAVIKPLELPDDGSVFVAVYRNRDEQEWIKLFVQATRDLIKKHSGNDEPIIIEGAIANPITLSEIFEGYSELTFIYFHPKNLDNYVRNITNRFMLTNEQNRAGLTSAFWNLIDQKEFEIFCKNRIISTGLSHTLEKYAVLSKDESARRLNEFKKYFDKIEIVEI